MATHIIEGGDTASPFYADRLKAIQQARWKRLLSVQAPYQWHLRQQRLGRTLEIGCGIGRNMASLAPGSVGIDHNPDAVACVRAMGFQAFTTDEWALSELCTPESFDGLLLSHVLEHMTEDQAVALLQKFLPFLRPGGVVFLVCPQEVGYRSDSTHVQFMDGAVLARICRLAGLRTDKIQSFPFPRWLGKLFIYNEFCLRAEKYQDDGSASFDHLR